MDCWSLETTSLSRKSWHARLLLRGAAVSFGDVIDAWQDDESFCVWFNRQLADIPFAAFRWEMPPLVKANLQRPFEYVLIDSPSLATRPDRQSFERQFQQAQPKQTVVTFANLSGDAILVAPCPLTADDPYAHLADFVRFAPESQRVELWQRVGEALASRVSNTPVWLSTAGAGVAWLHVRLDNRPKYYQHGPYRENGRHDE